MKIKSTKLTHSMRDAICRKILEDAFGEKLKAVEAERKVFSLEVYNNIYDEKTRQEMEALPDGWLPMADSFHVQFGSDSSNYCHRMLDEEKRFLAKHRKSYHQCLKVYDDNDELTIKHDDITERLKSIQEGRSKAAREALAILNSCNTTKQLKDVWPEIVKYVELYEPIIERTTEIAPITTELNKLLNL